MSDDDYADAIDIALIDWRATAEALQVEVNHQRGQLAALARWVATQRGRDWTLLPPVFGAGKASAVEAVARLLAGDDDEDGAANDRFAAWLTTHVVAHGTAPLCSCGGHLPPDTHSHSPSVCTRLVQPRRRRLLHSVAGGRTTGVGGPLAALDVQCEQLFERALADERLSPRRRCRGVARWLQRCALRLLAPRPGAHREAGAR